MFNLICPLLHVLQLNNLNKLKILVTICANVITATSEDFISWKT